MAYRTYTGVSHHFEVEAIVLEGPGNDVTVVDPDVTTPTEWAVYRRPIEPDADGFRRAEHHSDAASSEEASRIAAELALEELSQPVIPQVLTEQERQRYLQAHGARCPICQATEIESGAAEFQGHQVVQEVSCLRCKSEWIDEFRLDDVSLQRRRAAR